MFNPDDYKTLLNCMALAGESVAGKPISGEDGRILDAEGLYRKLFFHAASAYDLYTGTKVELPCVNCNFLDFTSIGTISRAAMECLFTFYYLFVNIENAEEQNLRYWAWLIDGMMYRQKYKPLSPQGEQRLEDELKYIESLRIKLKKTSIFPTLKQTVQDNLLKGKSNEWRRGKAWWQIGIDSGIEERHAKMLYTYLCGHAHSNSVSVMQIRDASNRNTQDELSKASLSMNMISMAYMINGYPKVFPSTKDCFPEGSAERDLIRMCFEIGSESLEGVDIDWSKVDL